MTDLTKDNLKHVYNKQDLLSFAKENWAHAWNRAIEMGFDEAKADEIVYDIMRDFSLKERDENGNLLSEKYPLRNIPTWFDFGDKDTITRGRIAGKSQNPQELIDIQFDAGQIDNILADKSTYEPGGLAKSFAKHASKIIHDNPDAQKESEMWLLNNLMSAQNYYMRESTMPFPQVNDYDNDWKDNIAQFFSTFTELESSAWMIGGQTVGRIIGGDLVKPVAKEMFKNSPKTLAAFGYTTAFKDGIKNRAKKALLKKYKNVPLKQMAGLQTRQELIERGVDAVSRNATHFGSWFGFTWGSGYKQDLVMQKMKNIEAGFPDKPLDTWQAMSVATQHSFDEGIKGQLMGFVQHKLAKMYQINRGLTGGHRSSINNLMKGKDFSASVKTLASGPLPKFGTEAFTLTALTELHQGIERTSEGKTFFDWDEIEKQGGFFKYSGKHLLTNTAILGGFNVARAPYAVSKKFVQFRIEKRIKEINKQIDIEKKTIEEMEKFADITDIDGNKVKLDIEAIKDLKNSVLEKTEHVEFLKLQKLIGKDINPYGDEFLQDVESMIKDPKMKAQETLQNISEYWTSNRHRVELLLENPKEFRKEIKEYLEKEYGEGVEISDKLIDNTVNMIKSSIEKTSDYIDKIHRKKQEQGGENEGKINLSEENKAPTTEFRRKENDNLVSEILSKDKNKSAELKDLAEALKKQQITEDFYNKSLKRILNDINPMSVLEVEKRTEQDIKSSDPLKGKIEELAILMEKVTGKPVSVEDVMNSKDIQSKIMDPDTGKGYIIEDKVDALIKKYRKEVDVEPTQKRDQDLAAADFNTIKDNSVFKLKPQKLKGKTIGEYIDSSLKNGEISQQLANELYYGINKYIAQVDSYRNPKKIMEIIDYVKYLHSKGIRSLSDTNRELTTEYIEWVNDNKGGIYEKSGARNRFNNAISTFFGTGTEASVQKIRKGWAYDYMGDKGFSPSVSEIGETRKTGRVSIEDVGGVAPTIRQKIKESFNSLIGKGKDFISKKELTNRGQEMSIKTYDLAENLLYVLGGRSPLIFRYLRVNTIDWVNGKIKEVKTGAKQKGLENLTNYPMRELHPEIWQKMLDAKGNRADNSKELLLLDVNGKPFKTEGRISVGREILNQVNTKIIENTKGLDFYGGKKRLFVQDYRRMILTDAKRVGGEDLKKIIDQMVVKHKGATISDLYDLSTRLGRDTLKDFYEKRELLEHKDNIIELHGGVGITPDVAKQIIDIGKKSIVRTIERLGELGKKKNIGTVGYTKEIQNNQALYTLAATETLSKVIGRVNEFENFKKEIVKDIPIIGKIKNSDVIIKNLYEKATEFMKDPEGYVKKIKDETRKNFFRYLNDMGINKADKKLKSDAILDILSSANDKQLSRFDNPDALITNRLTNENTINDMIEFNSLVTSLSPVKKMSTTNKLNWNKIQRRVKDHAETLKISESEMMSILEAFGVPLGSNLAETIRRASFKQLQYVEDYILSNHFETSGSPEIEAALKDIDNKIKKSGKKSDFLSLFRRGSNWMTFKNDVMKKLLGEEYANNLELYGAVLEKHRGRIEALEDNLLNIYATSKQVDSKGNIFYAPSMNPIKRAAAKMELKKYKDIMAAVTDPEIARWIMTSESQIKEGQLFIDVYMGKNAEAYKTFIKKAYKDNYKLRTDTMEGKAIKAIRDYYSQYKSLLGDVAKRTLSAKQYKEFVNLYGKNGEKWLDSYGHRRLSNEMLKYYTTDKDSGKPDAHEVIYQDILSQEVGKILVKEYKKGNVDIEKMSVEELLEWGNKHTINGEIVNDIAERKAIPRMGTIFNMETNRITASPLMSRAKGELKFSYVTPQGFQSKRIKRLLRLQEEIPTYEIGEGAFDNVIGGYNYSMAKMLSGLEFFKNFVYIEGIPGMKGNRGSENLAKALAKGDLKGLSSNTKNFIVNTLKELFDFGNPNSTGDIYRRKTLPLVAVSAKMQLSTPFIHGMKNSLVGQVMNLVATPEGFNLKNLTKFLYPEFRADVRKAGLTGAGTRIYDVDIPYGVRQVLEVPFKIGGTRVMEYYNRYTTDAVTMQALEFYVNKLKASKLTPAKGKKVDASKELRMLKDWYNLTDKQIELLETYGIQFKEASDLVKTPEFMKIKDEKLRTTTAIDYANTIQKARVIGAVRTQGTTNRAFTPRILDNKWATNTLLFKKMAYMGTLSSNKLVKMGYQNGSVMGTIAPIIKILTGSAANGWLLENTAHHLMGREISYQDEPIKRFFYYAFRGEAFSMAGEIAAWAYGINDKTRIFDIAPLNLASDMVGFGFDMADRLTHPNSHPDEYTDMFAKFAENQSGAYRFFDANIERRNHPYKKKSKDLRKRFYEWIDSNGKESAQSKTDWAPIYEPNELGRYGYVSGNKFNGMKKIQQLTTAAFDENNYWRVDSFTPLKYKRQIKDIFRGADFNKPNEWNDLKRSMALFLTSQMNDYMTRDEGVITEPDEALLAARKELFNYLTPNNFTGFDGIIYEPVSSKNSRVRFFPSEEKGKSGKPLYMYPKILMPIKNEKGQWYNGSISNWYHGQLKDKSPSTKKSLFWEYVSFLDEKDKAASQNQIDYLIETQERIEQFYKFLYTESGMFDIVVDDSTGKFYSNSPLHKELDINQLNEAYDIQKILFDGNMDIDPGRRKELLVTAMSQKVKRVQNQVLSDNEVNRILKDIKSIDEELQKLGVKATMVP